MPNAHRQRGDAAETAARHYLERAGLDMLCANVRFRYGELDLVMRDSGSVVFVEVRYRRNNAFGGGLASISLRKQQKLLLAAQLFLAANPELAQWPCRFDVIQASGDPLQLHWVRDAFRAESC